MSLFTLHVEDEGFSNTLTFEAENIDDVLMYTKMFIQGSGFSWVQGELQFVDDTHSPQYFDTERNR